MDHEPITIVVTQRDRFSTTTRCLEEIIRLTAEPYELLVVLGGVPEKIKDAWIKHFGNKVRFLFEKDFLNPAQSRNLGLRQAKTRLAVLIDNDVYARPGWLEPLLQCQKDTSAAMVVPTVLEAEHRIHTAGNNLLITYQDGKAYGQKVLCYAKMSLYEGCNLKRQRTEYGELHCQLVDVETALRLAVYDEHLREAGEVDSGLSWSKAGCEQWFEPASVVYYDFPVKITRSEDVRPFLFKWDMRATLEGYRYFEKKWKLDITECGRWQKYQLFLNNRLGVFSRLWPTAVGLSIDHALKAIYALPSRLSPLWFWRRFKQHLFGFDEWQKNAKS